MSSITKPFYAIQILQSAQHGLKGVYYYRAFDPEKNDGNIVAVQIPDAAQQFPDADSAQNHAETLRRALGRLAQKNMSFSVVLIEPSNNDGPIVKSVALSNPKLPDVPTLGLSAFGGMNLYGDPDAYKPIPGLVDQGVPVGNAETPSLGEILRRKLSGEGPAPTGYHPGVSMIDDEIRVDPEQLVEVEEEYDAEDGDLEGHSPEILMHRDDFPVWLACLKRVRDMPNGVQRLRRLQSRHVIRPVDGPAQPLYDFALNEDVPDDYRFALLIISRGSKLLMLDEADEGPIVMNAERVAALKAYGIEPYIWQVPEQDDVCDIVLEMGGYYF